MLKLFSKNQKDVNNKPVSEKPVSTQYTDKELFRALQKDGIGVTEHDIQKAKENDPETLYKIGDMYYKDEDYDKSFVWFYKAALQEHGEAQAQVGRMYQRGEGVFRDYKAAMEWSMNAASTGNAKAQFSIGEFYYYGFGVAHNNKQAMDWYLQAANNGNASAMNRIGLMYYNGKGVTKNIPTAIEWYTKTANQGDATAQNELGWIYQNEDGFKDLQKAVNWFQKADDNGFFGAKYDVEELNDQGYYAKEEEQEIETIQDDNATDITINDQKQSSTTSSNNSQLNKMIDDKIKAIEKTFQSKMSLMEVNTDALQKELTTLKQKELQQHEENMKLRDELAKLKERTEKITNNGLNYDSSNNANDSEGDHNNVIVSTNSEEQQDNDNTTANKTRMEENNDALQKELTAPEQTQLEQHEENNQLSDELAMLNAGTKGIINNDACYSSSENKCDTDNDINYDSESTNGEEDDNAASKRKVNKLLEKELVKREPVIQDDAYYDTSDNDNDNDNDNDFNYDTECSDGEEEENDNNAITKRNAEEVNNDALQKELAALNQKKFEQDEENHLLKERLARIKAGIEDESHNDPNCYSSDDESDKNNDINYDSECSEEDDVSNTHQTRNHRQWFETPADPNYDSSDNEDPGNGI